MDGWARELLLLLILGSFSFYAAVVITGLATSNRVGDPTISRMLADSPVLTFVFVAGSIAYGICRFPFIIRHVGPEEYEELWGSVLRYTAAILFVFFIVFLSLVGLVTLDYDETSHFSIAALSFIFAFFMECTMCARRWNHYGKNAWFPKSLNIFLLFVLFMMSVLFPVLAWEEEGGYIELRVAVFEYVLVGDVAYLAVMDLFPRPLFYVPWDEKEKSG